MPDTDGDNNEATATGNLNIKWGADSLDSGVDTVTSAATFNSFIQDHPGGIGNRSVTFTNTNVAVSGVATLSSHGDTVTFWLNADGTVLTGSAGSGGTLRDVIRISLSDEGSGQFRVVLLDQLDHAPGGNENDIGLRFNYTATDSDGDAVNGAFIVNVDDDMPVANTATHLSGQVNEDDLSAGAGGTDKTLFTAASLATLALSGADEPASIILQSAFVTGTVVKDIDNHDVTSHGFVVKYAAVGSDVVGFADANGDGVRNSGENDVFRISPCGEWRRYLRSAGPDRPSDGIGRWRHSGAEPFGCSPDKGFRRRYGAGRECGVHGQG